MRPLDMMRSLRDLLIWWRDRWSLKRTAR